MADTTTSSPQDKPRRKPTAVTTQPTPDSAAPSKEPAVDKAADATASDASEPTAAGWLRYEGQAPQVFMDLGGEIEPGQTIHPRSESLYGGLLARGDFEPADPPAPDSAGTAQ